MGKWPPTNADTERPLVPTGFDQHAGTTQLRIALKQVPLRVEHTDLDVRLMAAGLSHQHTLLHPKSPDMK